MKRGLKLTLALIITLVGAYLSFMLGMFLWGLFLPYTFIGAILTGTPYLFIAAPQLKKYVDKLYPEDKI
jgi:CHASE2 domain-containing sensor protein